MALIRENIDHLFMVPAASVGPFLPALGRFPKIKLIVAAQEGSAAYMADGYARASGTFRRGAGHRRPRPRRNNDHRHGGGTHRFIARADHER